MQILNIANFSNGFLYLTLGLIFGKFICTAIIQLSIWNKVNLIGLKPSKRIALKIFTQQAFLDWSSELKIKDLLIKILTGLFFFTFWFTYGEQISLVYCFTYLIFIIFFIVAWLENLKVPDIAFNIFLIIGSTTSFIEFNNEYTGKIFLILSYISLNYFFQEKILKKINIILLDNIKFLMILGVWFGVITATKLAILAYLLTSILREKNDANSNFLLKPKYFNPVLGISSLFHILIFIPNLL